MEPDVTVVTKNDSVTHKRSASAQVFLENTCSNCEQDQNIFPASTSVTVLKYSYPLKILIPDYASSSRCRWIYCTTYGGGLVEGDELEVELGLAADTAAIFTSSASTKVYPCLDGYTTQQSFTFTVAAGAFLAVLPDPVVCFADSMYSQKQMVHMKSNSTIVLIDWVVGGRLALGESWDMKTFQSFTQVYVEDKLIFHDGLRLEDESYVTIRSAMKNYNALATLVIIGQHAKESIDRAQVHFGKPRKFGQEPVVDPLVSVSPLAMTVPAVCVKVAASTTTKVFSLLDNMLEPIYSLIGGNPYENKY